MAADRTPYSELISALGRELSLPDLAPDADTRCHLLIDDRLDLNLLYRPDDDTVWIASPIGSLRCPASSPAEIAALHVTRERGGSA